MNSLGATAPKPLCDTAAPLAWPFTKSCPCPPVALKRPMACVQVLSGSVPGAVVACTFVAPLGPTPKASELCVASVLRLSRYHPPVAPPKTLSIGP